MNISDTQGPLGRRTSLIIGFIVLMGGYAGSVLAMKLLLM
jgi:hypothetical protein